MAETIRSAELSDGDRRQWQREVEAWQTELDNYGIEGFSMSLTALAQG